MIKFRITEEDGNHDSFYVGSVLAPDGMTQEQAEEVMSVAWDNFQAAKPGCDYSDFVEWLVEHYGFTEYVDDSIKFVVGG